MVCPLAVGSATAVADEMEGWTRGAELDDSRSGYVAGPGTFEEVVDLLVVGSGVLTLCLAVGLSYSLLFVWSKPEFSFLRFGADAWNVLCILNS